MSYYYPDAITLNLWNGIYTTETYPYTLNKQISYIRDHDLLTRVENYVDLDSFERIYFRPQSLEILFVFPLKRFGGVYEAFHDPTRALRFLQENIMFNGTICKIDGKIYVTLESPEEVEQIWRCKTRPGFYSESLDRLISIDSYFRERIDFDGYRFIDLETNTLINPIEYKVIIEGIHAEDGIGSAITKGLGFLAMGALAEKFVDPLPKSLE